MKLEQIVSDYITNKRKNAEAEGRWFLIQPTFEKAVSMAGRARKPSGNRFGHQRRIPGSVLWQSEEALLNSLSALRTARTFEELRQIILSQIGDIRGIGELTVYDTAVRTGAKLKSAPSVVFRHAGTRIGAKALGLDGSQRFIGREAFTAEERESLAGGDS